MVGLGSETPNTLTNFKSNVAIKKSDVKRQFITNAEAASSTIKIVASEITTNADAQDEADRKKTARLKGTGVKEAIASTIKSIVGAHITNPILLTTDGLDFRTVDEYELHQLLSAVKGGAGRPSATAIRQMKVDVMVTTFDWQDSAATNLEKLSTAIVKAATYGARFHNDMKGIVITANVDYTAHQTWRSELAEAHRKIKAKYLYNKVHDADSIIYMMKYLTAADEQRNLQEATSPENSKTANMANLGIDLLQQLAQQPPSDYASTDRDSQSAMSATSDKKSSAEKRVIEREAARKIRRDAVIGTAVEHHHHHRAVLRQDIAANLVQGEAAAGNQTNGTSTRPTVHTAKSLAAMAFPTHRRKMYRIQNATKTRSGRVGDQNGFLRISASPKRSTTTATNESVGTWTRSRSRKNGQE